MTTKLEDTLASAMRLFASEWPPERDGMDYRGPLPYGMASMREALKAYDAAKAAPVSLNAKMTCNNCGWQMIRSEVCYQNTICNECGMVHVWPKEDGEETPKPQHPHALYLIKQNYALQKRVEDLEKSVQTVSDTNHRQSCALWNTEKERDALKAELAELKDKGLPFLVQDSIGDYQVVKDTEVDSAIRQVTKENAALKAECTRLQAESDYRRDEYSSTIKSAAKMRDDLQAECAQLRYELEMQTHLTEVAEGLRKIENEQRERAEARLEALTDLPAVSEAIYAFEHTGSQNAHGSMADAISAARQKVCQ